MTMKKKGFTLIELLIVIAIIGILAVAFLPSLLGAPAKGRDAQRLATVQKIQNFIVTELLAGKTLPATALPAGCIISPGAGNSIGALITTNLANFGGVFPKDPQIANNANGNAACAGYYGYIRYDIVNHKYSAGVYAKVEIADNGNITCALAATDAVEPALGETGECYLALIQ